MKIVDRILDIDSRAVPIRLAYIDAHGNNRKARHSLSFLHEVRSPASSIDRDYSTSFAAHSYYLDLTANVRRFCELLAELECDLIVPAPSRRRDADPYISAARAK